MNAVILVGGAGTRLRPLTYAVPKPLIPVLNRPLISHILDNLKRHGVERVVFAASAGDQRLEEALGDGSTLGMAFSYCYETEPLGSGLAVKAAARGFDRAFFVCNGDVINNVDLSEMAARHEERGAVMSIFLAAVEDPSSYGIAALDPADRITRFVEKPPPGQSPSHWANAGTWLFDPEVLEHIPDEKMDGSIERLVMPSLIADGRLVLGYAAEDAYWMDVGTPERYLQIHADILGGRLPECLPDGAGEGPILGEDCQVWPDAVLARDVVLGGRGKIGGQVRVSGPSVIGDNATLREHAVVERSVLWSDVKVGAGAIVRNSIIGAGCWVGDNAVVENAVMANGARVQRDVRLGPGARLEPGEIAG
ncbi:MAG: NTP transferase domain-containing protein [Dehalococcoidia bacterium]|nr:NTP transferase domain-containing protein [Dehalococcoidia bacterium]